LNIQTKLYNIKQNINEITITIEKIEKIIYILKKKHHLNKDETVIKIHKKEDSLYEWLFQFLTTYKKDLNKLKIEINNLNDISLIEQQIQLFLRDHQKKIDDIEMYNEMLISKSLTIHSFFSMSEPPSLHNLVDTLLDINHYVINTLDKLESSTVKVINEPKKITHMDNNSIKKKV